MTSLLSLVVGVAVEPILAVKAVAAQVVTENLPLNLQWLGLPIRLRLVLAAQKQQQTQQVQQDLILFFLQPLPTGVVGAALALVPLMVKMGALEAVLDTQVQEEQVTPHRFHLHKVTMVVRVK